MATTKTRRPAVTKKIAKTTKSTDKTIAKERTKAEAVKPKKAPVAKPKIAKTKPAAKVAKTKHVEKPTADMTPLEKARLARANGTAKKKAPSTKQIWKAPADFHPALFEVNFKTDKDGFLSSKISALRIQGTYDKAPESARRLVEEYDPATLIGISTRIGLATYVANAANRLPKNTQFRVLYRVSNRKADNAIVVTVRNIWMASKGRSGATKPVELDRKDKTFTRIRRSTQFLPAAFATSIQPGK